MKRNFLKRIACVASAAVLCAGAVAMFAGCTTKYPEVTITYTFDGKDYAVTYKLSRYDAPKTVQHFIEVAGTGFYDGLCVHDYEDGSFLYTGGYTLENNELVEKDYFGAMKKAEKDGKKFTQTVWANGSNVLPDSPLFTSANDDMTPLYTVYGEFESNGNETQNSRDNTHSYGALVMYYTDKGNDNTRVTTVRNDNGKNNGGDKYNRDNLYKTNSATSLFYTFLGSANVARDKDYCVFGKVDEAGDAKLRALMEAVQSFKDKLGEDVSFTQETHLTAYEYMQNEPFESVKTAGLTADYNTPIDAPIIVKSVKVTKY